MSGMEDGWQRVLRNLADRLNNARIAIGQTGLVAPSVTPCAVIGTWYPVVGTFTDETEINDGFIVEGGEFKSTSSGKTTFDGSGNFSVNKVCEVTVGLFINGVNLENANTVITYDASARTFPASRAIAFIAEVGDVYDIRVKSNTVNTDVSIKDLNALFKGTSLL